MEKSELVAEKRRKHLVHETMIRSIDSLFLVGSAIGISSLFVGYGLPAPRFVGKIMGTFISYKNESFTEPLYRILSGIFLFLFVWQAFVALGLRRLVPFANFFGVGVAILGLIDSGFMGFHILGYQLFGAPLSTACCVAIIWLLMSSKGRYIFSSEYRQVIKQTPHIKSKLAFLVWGLVLLLIGSSALLTFGFPLLMYYLRSVS